MNLRRLTFATSSALLLFAAPAAASSTAAAGPSPTPLILEVILAVVVLTGMAVRRPVARAFDSVRRSLTPRGRQRTAPARARNF
jgi:DMSO reductase anchor subunit